MVKSSETLGMSRTPRVAAAAALLAVAAIAVAVPVVRGAAPALAGAPVSEGAAVPVDATERNHRVDLAASAPAPASAVTKVRPPRARRALPKLPEPLRCLNSHNPLCGPFRWSTHPGPNRPLDLEVAYTPEHPKAGDEVIVTVTATDPDAPIDYHWFSSGDGGAVALPSPLSCHRPFGTSRVVEIRVGEGTPGSGRPGGERGGPVRIRPVHEICDNSAPSRCDGCSVKCLFVTKDSFTALYRD